MVERGSITDEESLEQAYDIWVALKEAPNRAGERRDMTVKFGGDNTRRIFTLATALVDNGSHGDTPLQEAAGLISSLSGQEWTDLTLATAMRRITGDDVSEDDARSVMSSRVIKKLSEGDHAFNGVDPADEEIAEAEMLYETFIRLGESEKDVLNMVDQSLEGRWAETDVMLGVSRSAYDPNIRYAAPQAVSARESFGNFFDALGGGILKEAELTNTLISEMFTLGFFKGETDWGADALLAAPWEFAADSLIREHFENNMSEEDQTDFWSTMGYTGQAIDGTGQLVDVGDGTRKSPLRAGEHYKLIPDTAGSTDRPLYRVFVMNAQSNRMTEVPDFRLDLRPAMAQMQKNFNDFNENMARLKQEVAKNAPASVEDFLKLAEKFGIREGYTTPSDLIREGYGN